MRIGAALLAVLLLHGGGGPARGQDEAAPAPAASTALEQVRALLEQGDREGAIGVLETLRRDGNLSAEGTAFLGALLLETGQPGEALELLAPLAADVADPAVLYQAGRAALMLERIEEGERYLGRSLLLEQGTPAARELGLLRYRQQRHEEALPLLTAWLDTDPDDSTVRLAAVETALRTEDLGAAETLLGGLPGQRTDYPLLLGQLRLRQERPRDALAILEPLVQGETEQREPRARVLMAEAYLALNQSGAAIEILKDAEAADPRAQLKLAQAHYQHGDPGAAARILEPFARKVLATEGDPATFPPIALALALEYGRSLHAAGRSAEAVPVLELATRIQPAEHRAWTALGEALTATGQEDRAREALARFQELAAAEQRTRRAHQGAGSSAAAGSLERAVALLEAGDPEGALTVLAGAMTTRPEALPLRLLASQTLLLLDRAEEAFRIATQAVALAPESADARYQRGTVAMALGRLEDAERDLRRALAIAPGHTPAMNDLAVLLMSQGKREEARTLLERVLEITPGDPAATANLERLQGGASR